MEKNKIILIEYKFEILLFLFFCKVESGSGKIMWIIPDPQRFKRQAVDYFM